MERITMSHIHSAAYGIFRFIRGEGNIMTKITQGLHIVGFSIFRTHFISGFGPHTMNICVTFFTHKIFTETVLERILKIVQMLVTYSNRIFIETYLAWWYWKNFCAVLEYKTVELEDAVTKHLRNSVEELRRTPPPTAGLGWDWSMKAVHFIGVDVMPVRGKPLAKRGWD